jgi:hypothetical protein
MDGGLIVAEEVGTRVGLPRECFRVGEGVHEFFIARYFPNLGEEGDIE